MKIKNRIYSLLLVFVMAVTTTVSVPASQEVSSSPSNGRVEELKELISMLSEDRQIIIGRSVDFSIYENLYLHPHFEETMIDARFALLREFNDILMEAVNIQSMSRGVANDSVVISLFAQPNEIGDAFTIGFTDVTYFTLIDAIVEFTGIEEDMLEIAIYEPFNFFPIGQPVDVDLNVGSFDANHEGIEPTAIMSLPMGTRLLHRHPNCTIFREFGTLGHPANAGGARAFGTNHGVVPIGSTVYNSLRLRIGTVVNASFSPNAGQDVSLIQFAHTHSVHLGIPGASQFLTTFFANPTSTQNIVTMHVARGNLSGTIRHLSADVPFPGMTFRNVILASMIPQAQDSGAALTSVSGGHGRAYGTLIGGNATQSIFGRATSYQHIR